MPYFLPYQLPSLQEIDAATIYASLRGLGTEARRVQKIHRTLCCPRIEWLRIHFFRHRAHLRVPCELSTIRLRSVDHGSAACVAACCGCFRAVRQSKNWRRSGNHCWSCSFLASPFLHRWRRPKGHRISPTQERNGRYRNSFNTEEMPDFVPTKIGSRQRWFG